MLYTAHLLAGLSELVLVVVSSICGPEAIKTTSPLIQLAPAVAVDGHARRLAIVRGPKVLAGASDADDPLATATGGPQSTATARNCAGQETAGGKQRAVLTDTYSRWADFTRWNRKE